MPLPLVVTTVLQEVPLVVVLLELLAQKVPLEVMLHKENRGTPVVSTQEDWPAGRKEER